METTTLSFLNFCHSAGMTRKALVTIWVWIPRLSIWGRRSSSFAVTDEGVAAYEGDVEGFVVVDEGENFFYEFVPFEVGELTELGFAAEVSRIEGIASGAA